MTTKAYPQQTQYKPLVIDVATYFTPKLFNAIVKGIAILLAVVFTLAKMLIAFAGKFGVRIDFRYGIYALSFNDILVLGIDLSGSYSYSPIIIASPFGY